MKGIATLKTKASFNMGFALTFSLTILSQVSHAQQENDDPNWRERDLERRLEETKRLQKELERLEEQIAETRRETEKRKLELLRSLNRPNSPQKSRFLDIYEYGPIYRNPGLT